MGRAEVAVDVPQRQDQRGQDDHQRGGERKAEIDHETEHADQHEQIGDGPDDTLRDEPLEGVHVRRDTGHEPPHGIAIEERK